MTKLTLALAAAATALATPAAAATVAIDFEGGSVGFAIGATYSALGVTFSNAQFSETFGLAGTSGTRGVSSLSAAFQFAYDAADAVVATFSVPVTQVSFLITDVGAAGARLEAFDASSVLIDFDEAFGVGVGIGNFRTFSVSGAIASVRIFQPAFDDSDGIVVDNLSFETTDDVPAPGAAGLALLGLAGLAIVRRRAR